MCLNALNGCENRTVDLRPKSVPLRVACKQVRLMTMLWCFGMKIVFFSGVGCC